MVEEFDPPGSIPAHEVPFVTHMPVDGRQLLLHGYWDHSGEMWWEYMPLGPSGRVFRIEVVDAHSGFYYAHQPRHPHHLRWPLGTLIAQHLSFPGFVARFYWLVDDLHQLSASVEKIELFRRLGHTGGHNDVAFLSASELEYAFTLARSMYDVLHELIDQAVQLLHADGGHGPRVVKNKLPGSFNDMLKNDTGAAQLQAKYALPPPLAAFYEAEAAVFANIRAVRDSVVHGGRGFQLLGSGLDLALEIKPGTPLAGLPLWEGQELQADRFGSVRSLMSWLAIQCLGVTDRLAAALRATVPVLPRAVVGDLDVFVVNPVMVTPELLLERLSKPWE